MPYVGVVRPFTFRTVIDEREVSVEGQVLVVLSASKATLDREHRHSQIAKIERALAEIASKLNQRRYKNRAYILQRMAQVQQGNLARRLFDITLSETDGEFTLTYTLNPERLAQEEAQNGKYLVGTTDQTLTGEEILARSKLRDRIEKRIGVV